MAELPDPHTRGATASLRNRSAGRTGSPRLRVRSGGAVWREIMRTHKHAGTVWNLTEVPTRNSYSPQTAHSALLMDIRDELQTLNALLNCARFIAIPTTLNKIAKNTTKRKRK